MANLVWLGAQLVLSQLIAAPPPAPEGDRALVEALTAAADTPRQERVAPHPAVVLAPQPVADEGLGAALKLAAMAVLAGGVVAGSAFAVRRLQGGGAAKDQSRSLRMMESLWIGRGQRLMLVAVGRERVLLGVAGGAIHQLAIFGEGAAAPSLAAPVPVKPGNTRTGLEKSIAQMRDDRDHPSFLQDDDFASVVQGELRRQTLSGRDKRSQILQRLNAL